MSLDEFFVWKHSMEALDELEEILKCQLCKKIFENPLRFSGCGHLVCKECAEDTSNICPVCDVPSCKSDITSDHIFRNIITGYELISQLLTSNRSRKESVKESIHDGNHKDDVNIPHHKDNVVNTRVNKPTQALKVGRNPKSDSSGKRRTRSYDRKSSESRKISNAKVADDCSKGNSKPSVEGRRQTESKAECRASTPPKRSLNKDNMKRNKKGETPLHIACIKGDKKKVEELLKAGSSPCTKDNAGWTPLHEAVSKGYKEIVELLLKNGSFVNAPGLYNNTPLHDAVIHQHLDIIKLLLLYGADPDICNIEGNSARNLAETDEVVKILEEKPAERRSSTVHLKPISYDDPVLLGCNLDSENQKMLSKFAHHFKLKLVYIFNPDVTHVLVETNNNQCSSSVPILHAILRGKWIVNTSWIYQCLHQNELVDPSEFEVKGTMNHPNSEGPAKGRRNAEHLLPSIFNGCFFYLASGKYSVGESAYTKSDLTTLIRHGDGVLLTREPNPEAIPPLECTVPYHAHGTGPFARCSHYIIYQPGRGEPQLKYSMAHVKSLPVSWLLHCIEAFSMVPP